ncbi:hypothetical protein BC832DRAFT_592829 [Gaertneriomyces semiglobifer]|nr:hypothetical protein BC832DRAFT_592829 [Gaertneriomyces semiglobifer]
MKTARITNLENDIDAYRLKGQWVLTRHLAEKYKRKFFPNGTAREFLVTGEAIWNILLDAHRDEIPYDSGPVVPSIVSALGTREIQQAQAAALELNKAVEKGLAEGGDQSQQLIQQARVYLAQIDLWSGQSEAALKRLESVDFSILNNPATSHGIWWILSHLIGLTVRALAYHKAGADAAAYECLEHAVNHFAKHSKMTPPTIVKVKSTAQPDEDQWIRWFQIAHYSHIVIGSKLGHLSEVRSSARRYLERLADASPPSYQSKAKVAVVGIYFRSLLGLGPLQPPPQPLSGIPTSIAATPNLLGSEVRCELQKYLPLYETLATNLLSFPRGEDVSPLEATRYDHVHECYDWWTLLETSAPAEETMGEAVDRHYRLIETLYRGTRHTFHSMRLLRYLSHAFNSLISIFGDNMPVEEKAEAEATVDSYVFFWEKHLRVKIDLERKARIEVGLERRSQASMFQLGDSSLLPAAKINGTSSNGDVNAAEQCQVPHTNGAVDGPHAELDGSEQNAGVTESKEDLDEEIGVISVGEVDGEHVADAVGVLIVGTSMCLANNEGDDEKVRKASRFAAQAVKLLDDHGSTCGSKLPGLQFTAYKWLGVAYGELALEVRDSQLRRTYQKEALVALLRAKALKPECWDVLYQRALQLAEIGEIGRAILRVKDSLQRHKSHAPSWNLLALLLSAKKDFTQAIQVCDMGAKECLSRLERSAVVHQEDSASGRVSLGTSTRWSYDHIDTIAREELINLKLTRVALEASKYGPKVALASVKKLLRLARRFFGELDGMDERRNSMDSVRAPSLGGDSLRGRPVVADPSHGRNSLAVDRNRHSPVRPASVASSRPSSSINVPTSPDSVALYRFRIYDLFVCLWLTASSLYRAMEHFDEADKAIKEAERIVETMARVDILIKGTPGRLYQSVSVGKSLQERSRKGFLKLGKTKRMTGFPEDAAQGLAKWGPVGHAVRRVIADVAFEAAMIRQAKYDKLNTPPPPPKFAKYMAPAARLESERELQAWSDNAASGDLPISPSQLSLASARTTSAASTRTGRDGHLPLVTAEERVSSAISPPPPVQMQINGAPLEPLLVDSTEDLPRPSASSADEKEPLTLYSLIDTFHHVGHIDDDHLGTRVHLATLYYQRGDIALAEHFLERACKSSKARGGGGGKSGQASWYGGATGRWGWDGWRWLSRCLVQMGRSTVAREAIAFSVKLERGSGARGLECLKRVVGNGF